MVMIEDPQEARRATVSTTNRLNVSAKAANRMFYASRDRGRAYTAIYDDIAAAAGEYIAYLKNTADDKNLFIKDVIFGGAENIKFKIFHVAGVAASGEVIVPTSMNLSKNIPAEAEAMAGNIAITGLTAIDQIGTHRVAANTDSLAQRHSSTILGPGDAVAIEFDAGTAGLCEAEIHFWYEMLDDK